jgi:hypothetical protein
MEVRMRRVVHREIGGSKRGRSKTSGRTVVKGSSGQGFGRLLSQLLGASSTLERSRTRVGSR